MSRKRSAHVALGALAAAAALAGCSDSPPDPQYGRVCVEEATQLRVDDDRCPDGALTPGYVWWYFPYHYGAPAVGSKVDTTRGSFTKPAGSIGSVGRGGFGGRVGGGS